MLWYTGSRSGFFRALDLTRTDRARRAGRYRAIALGLYYPLCAGRSFGETFTLMLALVSALLKERAHERPGLHRSASWLRCFAAAPTQRREANSAQALRLRSRMLLTQRSPLGGTGQLSEQSWADADAWLGSCEWNLEPRPTTKPQVIPAILRRHTQTDLHSLATILVQLDAVDEPQLLRTSSRDVLSAHGQLPGRHSTAIEGGPSTATPLTSRGWSHGITIIVAVHTAVPISVRATSNSRLRYYRPLRYDSIEELLVADRRSETWRRDS